MVKTVVPQGISGFDSLVDLVANPNYGAAQQERGWSMSEYSFSISTSDTIVAYECEADRAEKDGFANVAKRQRDTALHLLNAVTHMQTICPDGYRVDVKIVVAHVPNVNAKGLQKA